MEHLAMNGETIAFDHCYQKISSGEEYARLERYGFTLYPHAAEHPHSLLSRFIRFGDPSGPDADSPRYLEWCLIRDFEGELAHARNADPHAMPRDLFRPGLSMRCAIPLDDCFHVCRDDWAAFQPSLTHRNYDWTQGEEERRPGWNFLEFARPPVPGVHLWLTEYERRLDGPQRKAHRELQRACMVHSNGVTAIAGCVFNLSESGKTALSKLFGGEWRDGVLMTDGGFAVYSQRDHPTISSLLAAKTSPFTAVLLSCPSLAHFSAVAGLDKVEGLPLVHIRSTAPESWDIFVIENGLLGR